MAHRRGADFEPRPARVTPAETPTRLLDSAETLFADQGYEDTSIREITELAGANVAAINYHFGSKLDLLRAVLDRVVVPINLDRFARLDAAIADARGRPVPLERLLEAFLAPDLVALRELQTRGERGSLLLARVYGAPGRDRDRMIEDQFRETAARFLPEFVRAAPDVDPEEVVWRVRHLVVGIVVGLFTQAREHPVDTDEGFERTLRRLIAALVPMISAPAPGLDAQAEAATGP